MLTSDENGICHEYEGELKELNIAVNQICGLPPEGGKGHELITLTNP